MNFSFHERKQPKELEEYDKRFDEEVCVSFPYTKMENPIDEEHAPRLLQAQIYVKQTESGDITELRIEISDNYDTDFLYISKMTQEEFNAFQE